MKHGKLLGLLAAIVVTVPTAAYAQSGYVSKDVNLRAGPAREYPSLAILRAGVSISVLGCLTGYQWCDVLAGPNRGWVYAGNIVYPYQGSSVPVITYGAALGLGIVAFSVGHYWDSHYRARPWYGQRQQWIERPHGRFVPEGHRPPPPHAPAFRPGAHRPPPPHAPVVRPGDHRPPPPHAPAVRPGDHRPQPTAPAARPGDHRPPRDQGQHNR